VTTGSWLRQDPGSSNYWALLYGELVYKTEKKGVKTLYSVLFLCKIVTKCVIILVSNRESDGDYMTDIEKALNEIKIFLGKNNPENNTMAVDDCLVLMCNFNTKKIIDMALNKEKITIDNKNIYIFASKYYAHGDIYIVEDKDLKYKILKQYGIQVTYNRTYSKNIRFYTNYTSYKCNGVYYTINNDSYSMYNYHI
jgi:hypothetical protein